jgi:hypothetical protein
MNAIARWKAWIDSDKAESARRVLDRVAERAGLSPLNLVLAPYPKGGFVAEWLVTHAGNTRDAVLIDMIRSGQRVASGWVMTGSVDEDFGAVASTTGTGKISVAGITMLTWELNTESRG